MLGKRCEHAVPPGWKPHEEGRILRCASWSSGFERPARHGGAGSTPSDPQRSRQRCASFRGFLLAKIFILLVLEFYRRRGRGDRRGRRDFYCARRGPGARLRSASTECAQGSTSGSTGGFSGAFGAEGVFRDGFAAPRSNTRRCRPATARPARFLRPRPPRHARCPSSDSLRPISRLTHRSRPRPCPSHPSRPARALPGYPTRVREWWVPRAETPVATLRLRALRRGSPPTDLEPRGAPLRLERCPPRAKPLEMR